VSSAAGESRRIFDFSEPEAREGWFAVDDRVMGGVSRSRLEPHDGHVRFAGRLSLENNGGFASMRSNVPEGAFAGAERVHLLVRGDGRAYELIFKTGDGWDAALYRAPLATLEGEWVRVELPLRIFRATWRGREAPRAPALAGEDIAQVGFMLADKSSGGFGLECKWMDAVRRD
jgi:hypothetical protein